MDDGLKVCVSSRMTGRLVREHKQFIFNYNANAQADDAVSLTMPVRHASYTHHQLHPIFEMHLPEGYLRSVIQKHFSKLTETDDSVDTVRLAPAYDVVSTTCYIKHDIAALTLMGSKKWWGRKHLVEFGINACELTLRQAEKHYDECLAALNQTALMIQERLDQELHDDKKQVLSHLLTRMTEC